MTLLIIPLVCGILAFSAYRRYIVSHESLFKNPMIFVNRMGTAIMTSWAILYICCVFMLSCRRPIASMSNVSRNLCCVVSVHKLSISFCFTLVLRLFSIRGQSSAIGSQMSMIQRNESKTDCLLTSQLSSIILLAKYAEFNNVCYVVGFPRHYENMDTT